MKFYHSFLSTPLMRFLEDFFREAGRRGNVLALENGACSHCIQNITTFVWLCLQNYFDFVMFQIVLVLSATWLIMPQYLLCQMSLIFFLLFHITHLHQHTLYSQNYCTKNSLVYFAFPKKKTMHVLMFF